MLQRLFWVSLWGILVWDAMSKLHGAGLRAGVSAVEVTPWQLPVIQNGGFLEATRDRVDDPLFVRAFVFDDGKESLALAVVDSCMLPRPLCDEVKKRVQRSTGIAHERMLIAATHTHSAPGVMDFCLGSRQDPRYARFLPAKIAEAMIEAFRSREPVEIAATRVDAGEFTKNRRWITRPDKMGEDPFGERSVRAMMHPGYSNPDYIGPSGPTDPWLTVMLIRAKGGRPLGLLANFSMHYFSGHGGISADYFGEFSRQMKQELAPDEGGFVAAMSQGTSGDLWRGDYRREKAREWDLAGYTAQMVDAVLQGLEGLPYHPNLSLSMAEQRILLYRRLPDGDRLAWAKAKLNEMAGRRPQNRPEVYAEQAMFIHSNPVEELVLQAIRIGDLAITAIPNEVYALTGLKLKAISPLPLTMNISLANGAAGYIPPPEQHELGGYTTWPARTAGLEVSAEPKIVSRLGALLEQVSGRSLKSYREPETAYSEAVGKSGPRFRWRMGDQQRQVAQPSAEAGARFVGKVAFHLPGLAGHDSGEPISSRSVQFVGGHLEVPDLDVPENYTLEFWFQCRVGPPFAPARSTLFSWGSDGLTLKGDSETQGIRLASNDLVGETPIPTGHWQRVVYVRRGASVQVYLNGNRNTELSWDQVNGESSQDLIFAASSSGANAFEGRLDEIALFDRPLSRAEAFQHFRMAAQEASAPLSPEAGRLAAHLREGYQLEVVAAEPLVRDPVAIDWGSDGRLWVAEMADYPYGMDGKGAPGGRIRYLEDRDGDGRFDHSQLFLEGVNFPTSVMPWRSGVLVAAAPEIFWAEDRDGDGRADHREVLYRGFMEGNQQLRVNSLRWGLDGWVYCASGGHHAGFGAENQIQGMRAGQSFPLGSHDFRFAPDSGRLESLSGPSQFGRVRDDWGAWFGVQNSRPLWHYVLEERYLARNPGVAYADPRVQLRTPTNPRVFMNKPVQKRFHSFDQSSRFTSACGISIYRDQLLFPLEPGLTHAFTCEPFHNVVQHHVITESGVSFHGRRAHKDGDKDFYASSDRWSRPVMTRTGPDGALYIVDMYRYMIEHPDWLPETGKHELKSFYRSGEDYGRIYRVSPVSRPASTVDWEALDDSDSLLRALRSRNGRVRDLAQQRMVEAGLTSLKGDLEKLARTGQRPTSRLQAVASLHGLGILEEGTLEGALRDADARVRRNAVRFCESRTKLSPALRKALLDRVEDNDLKVRFQVALALGSWEGDAYSSGLLALAKTVGEDQRMASAVVSSMARHFNDVYSQLASDSSFVAPLASMASADPSRSQRWIEWVARNPSERWGALAAWWEAQSQRGRGIWERLPRNAFVSEKTFLLLRDLMAQATERAQALLEARSVDGETLSLLGRMPGERERDGGRLLRLVDTQSRPRVRKEALVALRRFEDSRIARRLLAAWQRLLVADQLAVVDLLLGRTGWVEVMMGAFESDQIRIEDLDAARQQRLLRHPNRAIAARARHLLEPGTRRRSEVEQRFHDALDLKGDLDHGRSLFEARCGLCHRLGEIGREIGPDLRSLTQPTRESLLTAIVQPNRVVEPKFRGYEVILKNGETLYGLVEREEAGGIVFRGLDGAERFVARGALTRVRATKTSFMPEGLEAGMSVEEMASLLGFLESEIR